jgi:hypothetical protein
VNPASNPIVGKAEGATLGIRSLSFSVARAALNTFSARPMTVFIMGHMRCGSTLLLHLLLTTPEIIACGERNAAYRTREDLDKLEIEARIAERSPFRRVRYVADQINHDQFTPNLELLRGEQVRCVFLVREPESTIQSILNLTRTFYKPWLPSQAVDYYSQRLRTLTGYAADLDGRNAVLAITYEDLITHTAPQLHRLSRSLGLDKELREHYGLHPFTGKRGDPSPTIRAGRIVQPRISDPVEVPNNELARAFRAYEDCARTLQFEARND